MRGNAALRKAHSLKMTKKKFRGVFYGATLTLGATFLTSVGAAALSAAPNPSLPVGFHHATPGYLGVDFEDLTDQQRATLQAPLRVQDKQGVAIAAVDQDAPAGQAGLTVRDILLRINNQPALNALQVRSFLRQMKPGQQVSLTLVRDGNIFQKNVLLANRKDVEERAWSQHYSVPDPSQHPSNSASNSAIPAQAMLPSAPPQPPAAGTPPDSGFWNATSSEFGKVFGANGMVMSWIPWTNALYTGVVLDTMEPQLAGYFHIQPGSGLLVRSVDNNSPGSRAGLHAGDIVLKVDDVAMTSRSKWQHVVHANRKSQLLMEIQRERQPMTLTMSVHATK